MAHTNVAAQVAKLIEELRAAGAPKDDEAMTRLAAKISRGFEVRKDEVAILHLFPDTRVLKFLYPLRLAPVGSIPITTTHSLAAKTIRERRGEIVNNFGAYRHPTIFEAVDLYEDERAVPIVKIMSSPLIVDGKVVGVIQVSRKGRSGEPVGPDFTHDDLTELAAVGSVLGKYLAESSSGAAVPPKTKT